MEPSVVDTLFLAPAVGELIKKYYIPVNEAFLKNDRNLIDLELRKYEDGTYADLYLIAYADHLKKPGDQIVLVTDESRGKDKKLIEKIPTICRRENEDIECRKLPYMLFQTYKEELQFALEVLEEKR
jgi:acid phosphatase class B